MANTIRTWRFSPFSGKLEDALVREDAAIGPDPASLTKDQLIVEVISAALNPVDYKLPEAGWVGSPMVPKPATPGQDYCGRVVAKHPSNHSVELGQVVFGGFQGPQLFGSTGEKVRTSMSECAVLPEGVKPAHAAALGIASTTAYQSIVKPGLGPGSKVFINGGSGGVGTWAIQIAKARGAEVVVSCSGANAELCRQLGADEIIDYKSADVIAALKAKGRHFDAVIDNVGAEALYRARGAILKPHGWFEQVGTPPLSFATIFTPILRQLWPSFLNPGWTRYVFIQQRNAAEYFEQLGKWMVEGKLRAVIDSEYDWEDVPAAFAKLRSGRCRGKIVINVGKE